MTYISKIRQKLDLLLAPLTANHLQLHLNSWFIAATNLEIVRMSLPCLVPITSFSRERYVCESDTCTTLASYKLSNAGLGNRAPRLGRVRSSVCSLCNGTLDEAHVAFLCPRMDDFRYRHTDIMFFTSLCRTKGVFPQLAYKWYVRGLSWDNTIVPLTAYLQRGRFLKCVTDEWLRRT